MLCNLEVLADDGAQVDLRFNWHTLSHRYKTTDSYFGTSFYRLDIRAEQPLITRKKVVLKTITSTRSSTSTTSEDTAMTYAIALNFEDGVTRFIDCKVGEKVLDAAFRQRINLPMDCSDGVCGTCKCRCETGAYDLGDDFIDDALSADEAQARHVLTCQMVPQSDCVIAVPVPSSACKTGTTHFAATLAGITRHADAALEVSFELDQAPVFLPGQYVNISVPDSGQTRAYSFSSRPGDPRASFLIKHVPGGLMSSWLERAQPGDSVAITGPLGSFYLRGGAAAAVTGQWYRPGAVPVDA